jgi:hypothetical protein
MRHAVFMGSDAIILVYEYIRNFIMIGSSIQKLLGGS